ncbi:gliding motility-associated C-terminal domain-containing protein [Dyadobacter sp. BHUBP1]|uniref:T9SS type B sorting domain-containing protein n=1 Tax=Dyadobacter sp. BHUBP1 TaxID=3424178 RepID=UPI003D3310AE
MKHRLLIIFLLGIFSLVHQEVSGQSFCSTTGAFTVTPEVGCAPMEVTITSQMTNAESVTYSYNFDRNSTSPPKEADRSYDLTHTYNVPGTYTILQYGSIKDVGGFSLCKDVTVKETRGPKAELISCPNGKVRVTLGNDAITKAYDMVIINWGDGKTQNVNPKTNTTPYFEHTYDPGSLPAITLKGSYTSTLCNAEANTTTLTAGAPQSLASIRIRSVEMPADGNAKIIYDGMEGIETKVYIAKGNGDFIFTNKSGQTGGSQSVSVPLLDPKVVYRFQLWSTDICGNVVQSPIVSSIAIKQGGLSLDEIISLEWENEPNTKGLVEYQLKRNGAVIFSDPLKRSYEDTDVKCGNTYQYDVVAIIENDVRSYSAPISLEPKTSAPGDITNALVTVKDENTISTKVELSGEGLTSEYNLIVERALLGTSNFELVSPANNQSLQWDDTNVSTSQNSYCYRFQYENACKMKSPSFSTPVCSILLTTNTPDIVWNPEAPFISTVETYTLQQVDKSGNVVNETPKGLSTNHTLDLASQSDFGYRIEAKSSDGNFVSLSNLLNFRSEAILLVPDAFTPNGDAYNERFEVKAYFVKDFKMSVFSRWGEVVYHSNDIAEGWDGNIKTGKAPGGYYLYKIEATNASGQTVVKNGSFLLIR